MTDTPDATPAEAIARTPAEIANDVFRRGGTWEQVLDAALGPRAAEIAARATAAQREADIKLAIHHRVFVRIRHNDDGTVTWLNRGDWYPFADLLGGASHSAQTAPAAPGSVPKVTGPEPSHHDGSVDPGATQGHT